MRDWFETNATRVPSGDTAEWLIASPESAVIWRAVELPSSGMVHKLRLPLAGLLYSNV